MLAMGVAFLPAFAQTQHGVDEKGDMAAHYQDECRRHGVSCTLHYGDKKQEVKTPSTPHLLLPGDANSNLVLIVSLSLGFLLILGLWLYFGSGGVLLSSEGKTKRHRTIPEGWHAGEEEAHRSSSDFFQQITMMSNRREALIKLLRHCLLHAARASHTRLARADTERAVLRRLPQDLPRRDNLETLLQKTELAHYGGVPVDELQFATLLALARAFVQEGQGGHIAHA